MNDSPRIVISRQPIYDEPPLALVVDADRTVFAAPEEQRSEVVGAFLGMCDDVTFVTALGRDAVNSVLRGKACMLYDNECGAPNDTLPLKQAATKAMLFMGIRSSKAAFVGEDASVAEWTGMRLLSPEDVLHGLVTGAPRQAEPQS